MIPFIKAFSLTIKLFTRPILNYTKNLSIQNHKYSHPRFRLLMLYLGTKHFDFEQKIDIIFRNQSQEKQFFIKKINDEQAILKGIDVFFEIFIYSFLLAFSVYEITSKQIQDNLDEQQKESDLMQIQAQIDQLEVHRQNQISTMNELQNTRINIQESCQQMKVKQNSNSIEIQQLLEIIKIQNQIQFQQKLLHLNI